MTELTEAGTIRWSPVKKGFFLFVLSYTIFFTLFPIPDALTFWVGETLLGIKHLQVFENNGGGDTTFDYVVHITQIALCLLLTLLVLIIDRRRKNYIKIEYWLLVVIRYQLAFLMLEYGFAKVFKTQFPFPNLGRLTEPYGESSPMGLLWAFMGYSTGYNIFIGATEMLGGFLLFFRRTTALGALIVFMLMLNVALLNMFYDVAVKIFSIELVFFSLVLLWPNLKRFYRFFILHQQTALVNMYVPVLPKWMNITRLAGKYTIISAMMIYSVFHYYGEMTETNENAVTPPLYGVYKTELFTINKDTLLASGKDSIRWDELIIDRLRGRVRTCGHKQFFVLVKTDTLNHTLTLHLQNDPAKIYTFVYLDGSSHLQLKGVSNKDSLSIRFKKIRVDSFLLVNRGFHWVNEFPLNK